MQEEQEFGPSGYLPERAARRARKIILRAPLGIGWVLGSLVAAALIVVLGVVYLLTVAGPPSAPFTAVGPIEQLDPRGAGSVTVAQREVVVLRATGAVRAFAAPESVEVVWCAPSSRLEGTDGTVWEASGRQVGGPGGSLARLPVEVHDGVLYLDASGPGTSPAPQPRGEEPVCETAG